MLHRYWSKWPYLDYTTFVLFILEKLANPMPPINVSVYKQLVRHALADGKYSDSDERIHLRQFR
jgi:hypothetical protein